MYHPPQLRQRVTAAATAVGTLAVTLSLLAGMPYVLWRAAGLPWPEHVASLSEFAQRLAQPVSDPMVIDLLALVGWVCWAVFAYTVVRETVWYATHLPQLLRDRHTHHEHLAALSVKGSLAALCIGTLVVALIGLCRPQTLTGQQSSPREARPHTVATAPLLPSQTRRPAPVLVAETMPIQETAAALPPAPARVTPPGDAETVRHIEYTVIEGDTLWDIAHAYMGDALTWPRIYALNKDRVQSDGARLTDPDLIRPGWRLTIPVPREATLPPTSAPAPAHQAPDTTPTKKPPENPSAQPTLSQDKDVGRQDRGQHTPSHADRHNEVTAHKAGAQTGPATIGLGEASLIGITTAAGLLAARRYWYWHQNRRRDPDQETEIPSLSPLVDKAAQAAHAATLLRQSEDPDVLAPRRIPPQPPRAKGTVTIGVRQDTEVPLDELAVPGGCAWTGPGAEGAARALLVGVLTAAERRRPSPAHVTAVVPHDVAESLLPGLPAQFTVLSQSADLDEAIRTAEQHLITHARTHDEHDTMPATTGQASADLARKTEPGTLLLLAVPDAAHTGQLQALAARSRPEMLIVLTLGAPLPGATAWHIDADGSATPAGPPGQHPGALRLFHLALDAARDVTDVLLTAHGQRRPLRILPAPSPQPGADQPDTPAEPPPKGTPAHANPVETCRPAQAKPVRLHVLGPVTLYVRGHQDPVGTNLRGEVHEFLALLAAHPTGLLASDIADKLHLDPGSDQNALKNLRRSVRRALRAATGITAQEFILLQGELHKLHPELVETDLADFSHSLREAFPASDSGEGLSDALAAVRAALAHYCGPFAQGGDYLWADTVREHLAMKATDAAVRLARQAERAHATPRELDDVLTLLDHLGAIHPDHERLAQHTIRLYQASGRHDTARHTYTRLARHLTELGLEPEPATQALIAPRTRQTR
ncbi:BTAD domain-containing putative transcriptional regulator [Streptomyces sp. MMG1121]|uniref:BTAD domain-containing putative transcriptional regulator n=1 Tax=Streptomyces sp. MMG1121 TaxID=1415544 RepID=UPI0006AFC63C|nr:BTAD domain-containing putative transcriptional regulator [Streptomyces sp. MMG1121]KOV62873.1 transcriptional regulator [Streptomyces sp. MMG1121]